MKLVYKILKRILSLTLALFFLLTLFPLAVFASEAVANGTFGDALVWTLDAEGTLTISGAGAMPDYTYTAHAPWYNSRNTIKGVIIDNGVENIGDFAFIGCSRLESVIIGDQVMRIGNRAFDDCISLDSISIPKNVAKIGIMAFVGCKNLSIVYFEGDAPEFEVTKLDGSGLYASFCFQDVTATVYYPAGNITWTDEIMQDYSGNITWHPYEMETGSTSELSNGVTLYIPVVESRLDKYKHDDLTVEDQQKCRGLLYDLNGDNSVELILHLADEYSFYYEVWSIVNEKAVCVNEPFFWGFEPRVLLSQFEGSNALVYQDWSYGSGAASEIITVYTFEEIPYKESYTLHHENIFDIDTPDEIGDYYYINGAKVSENEYKERLTIVTDGIELFVAETQYEGLNLSELLDYLKENPTSSNTETLPTVEDIRVLCAYADNVDLALSLGEEMKVSYAMFINGEHTEAWNKPALAIANDDIISATQCEKNNIGYAVMIKGKRAGATHLTVTDGDSGASVTIYITVRDTYATPLSYIIDDVPSFTPEISLAKDVQTNIWDCYGLYVNDFPNADEIQKVDGNYLLEFNVYNENSMYGSIDVYDRDNNWIRSYPIEKYTGVQGLYDTFEGLQYLVKDTFSGNLLNYTSDSQSAYTRAKISVPEGGHFTISNNYLQSPGAYLYNSIDIIFTGANLTSDVMGFFDGFVSEITEDDALRAEFTKIFVEEFSSVALNLSTEFALEDYGVVAQFCSDNFFGIMTRLKIDFWGLAESYFNMAEDVLKEFLPAFIEHPLETIFTIQKFTDAICQLDDIKDSPNQPYIIMYTPEAGKGMTTVNGVTVIPGEGAFADNAVLQVFRISDSGNIIASDSGFVVDQYELYHICYTVDNNKVQPNGNVTIKIPIPATFNKDSCDVYHQQPDGSWEIVNTRIEGEFIVFEVDHFSLFAVVNSSEDNGLTQNNVSEDKDQENLDSMRIPLGIIGTVMVVLLIVVAVVIVKKRK